MAFGASPSFHALPRKIASPAEKIAMLACICALFVAGNACSTLTGQNLPAVQPANRGSGAIKVFVRPDSPMLESSTELQFTATVEGTSNTAVTWSASAGTISGNGLFRAPKTATATQVTVTATSVANSSHYSSSTVTIRPWQPLAIRTSSLSEAVVNASYNAVLSASGGTPPYNWTISKGSLAPGIGLRAADGSLSGAASQLGQYSFTVRVTDAAMSSANQSLTLTVSPAINSNFDGPAELPRVYLQTTLANTPAPGSTIIVNSGGDLQAALNSANCGDIIELQAGATFSGNGFTLPAKPCDDQHWIIVRTSAGDSLLPAEGSRLTPCYAGVSSLPGRPDFNCTSTSNVLAKLVMATPGIGPIVFASGANHYRLIGLEITRIAGSGLVSTLSSVESGGTASNLIFDRIWMHGTAQDDTNRGIWLAGSTYVSIVDSFLTDFHCVALTGACGDAQAIAGGIGSAPMGPYKITDNFLEASGENILFGGGEATSSPADIQVSRNHMFKPLTWMKGQPGYVGGRDGNPFVVKNLFELKNAQRVLLDGNIMENSWGGFTQVGYAILITPKNQGGKDGTNLCPICQVTDVTIRYTSISHVGAGLQIANGLAGTSRRPALDGQRYSIHDIVIDDIDGAKYSGPGEFAQISVSPGAPLLQNVAINHVTAFPSSILFVLGDMVVTSGPMKNVVFTNSIVTAGTHPVWSAGGGSTNCAYSDVPLTTFNACFTSSAFAANAIIATPRAYPAASWPASNFFPASISTAQFANYNGGDYHLQPSSPYKGKGTDGKDLGADLDAVNLAIAGVE